MVLNSIMKTKLYMYLLLNTHISALLKCIWKYQVTTFTAAAATTTTTTTTTTTITTTTTTITREAELVLFCTWVDVKVSIFNYLSKEWTN